MATELHIDDICRIAVDAGLAEFDDATDWLAARGICESAIEQYSRGIIDAAEASGFPSVKQLEGVFTTGLTLGIALGEASRVSS